MNLQLKSYSSATISKKIGFKKALLTTADHQEDKNADATFQYSEGLTILCAATSYYIAEPFFCLPVYKYGHDVIINTKDVERVLKDYLLHLFPSHYFW